MLLFLLLVAHAAHAEFSLRPGLSSSGDWVDPYVKKAFFLFFCSLSFSFSLLFQEFYNVAHPKEYPPEKVEQLCRKFVKRAKKKALKSYKLWENGFSQDGQDVFLMRAFQFQQQGIFGI
jgi:hypothetical protein